MSHHTEAERAEFELMRAAYEKAFGPPPIGAVWSDFGYAIKTHQASEARAYTERFKGFIAGWVARRAPAAPVLPPIHGDYAPSPMNPERASYFMERFLKEEKLLGPNEQAALHYVICMLAAAPQQPEAAPVELPEPDFYVRPSIAAYELPWAVCGSMVDGRKAAYLDNTVRELLAAHSIGKDKA